MHENDIKKFDMILGQCCGPALAGIKPANMINIRKEIIENCQSILAMYNQRMNKRGIYFRVIKETKSGHLVLVYREKKLTGQLMNSEVYEVLCNMGYPAAADHNKYVDHLRHRFMEEDGLPEEIGYFLGYPREDIIGFSEHKGRNSLMTKYWKVYENVREAEKIFSRYDKCKYALCNSISDGVSIMDIFAGGAA